MGRAYLDPRAIEAMNGARSWWRFVGVTKRHLGEILCARMPREGGGPGHDGVMREMSGVLATGSGWCRAPRPPSSPGSPS